MFDNTASDATVISILTKGEMTGRWCGRVKGHVTFMTRRSMVWGGQLGPLLILIHLSRRSPKIQI